MILYGLNLITLLTRLLFKFKSPFTAISYRDLRRLQLTSVLTNLMQIQYSYISQCETQLPEVNDMQTHCQVTAV
jgi:hypothetical protein